MTPSDIQPEEMRYWKGYGFTDLHIADALSGFHTSGFKQLPNGKNEFAVTAQKA